MSYAVYAIYFNTKSVFFEILSAINQFQINYNNKLKKICFSKVNNIDISNGCKYIVFFTVYDTHQDCYKFFKMRNLDLFVMGVNLLKKLDYQENWYIPYKSDDFTNFNLEDYTEFKKFLLVEDFIQ